MLIEEYKDITRYTTFGIPVKARYFAEYESEKELLRLSRTDEYMSSEVLHIGGGSNLLFLDDYNGMILHSKITGIQEYRKDSSTVFAIVGAGVKFKDFIEWCLARNLAGVENLSGIPGEVGASAIQNVGAYGVEAKDVIHAVECFDSHTRKTVRFTNEECRFGYRDSVFKHEFKNRYYVLRVSFRLNPDGIARSLEYGPLKSLAERFGHHPTLKEVSEEVIAIRNSKLPDPEKIGSAGSFFKNPVIGMHALEGLEKSKGEEIPHYPAGEGLVKLSAAWLIDHAGMKGATVGGASTYQTQPLVIVNNGNATARDVTELSEKIVSAVRSKYFVQLRPEVNFIDTSIHVTVLGSGTSKGVPEIACDCEVCKSTDPRDKRLRASVLVETQGTRILIDASPDLREQALKADIRDIDAVLITHSHYDHVGGIDDLRPFCVNDDLPMYVREDVNDDLHRRLDYCFRKHVYPGVPTFAMHNVCKEPFYINGISVLPISVMHGKLPILGFRIGKFAYVTDAKTIPEEEKWKLEGLDVLILNALRHKDHFAHLTIEEAVDLIEEFKPKEAYLTHFNHEAGFHKDLERELPHNVHPAYDGLHIDIR